LKVCLSDKQINNVTMARLLTQTIVIQVNKMVRNDDTSTEILDSDTIAQLEAVVTELSGSDTLVEITVD